MGSSSVDMLNGGIGSKPFRLMQEFAFSSEQISTTGKMLRTCECPETQQQPNSGPCPQTTEERCGCAFFKGTNLSGFEAFLSNSDVVFCQMKTQMFVFEAAVDIRYTGLHEQTNGNCWEKPSMCSVLSVACNLDIFEKK